MPLPWALEKHPASAKVMFAPALDVCSFALGLYDRRWKVCLNHVNTNVGSLPVVYDCHGLDPLLLLPWEPLPRELLSREPSLPLPQELLLPQPLPQKLLAWELLP